MRELLVQIMPNVVEFFPDMMKALGETIQMVGISALVAALFGVPIGILLLVTSPNHILDHKTVYSIVSKIVNGFRSVPFVILIAAIVPFTRFVMGTSIGLKGAYVPLVVGTIPFIARQVEVALYQIDKGVIEAAKAMGLSPFQIITGVILPEGLGGIVHALTLSIISLISFSAMAGTVGGGGIGHFAIQYGYQFFKTDIMIVTVIILLILVSIVQAVGNYIAHQLNH